MMSLIGKSIPQKIGVKLCKKTTTISNNFPSGFMGLSVLFSDFAPVESEVATYDAQKAVHIALEQILSASENVLSLLELSMDADQAYDWNSCNSLMPELNEIYAKCYKKTNRFLFFPLCISPIEANGHRTA